jgi:SlyX protein
MDERLTEIEIKIAHMEQSLNELSDVVYRQQQLLDRLHAQFDKLAETVASAEVRPGPTDASAEKPPHY